MKFLQTVKRKTMLIIIILLLVSGVCNMVLLLKIGLANDIVIENYNLISENKELTEQLSEAKNDILTISRGGVINKLKECGKETYRLARDHRDEFAEYAESNRNLKAKHPFNFWSDVIELNYLHSWYESLYYKNDLYFMTDSKVSVYYVPDNIYSPVSFRIYYFYDTSAIEVELAQCDYYKDMGNNVYYAVYNIGPWDFDPEDLVNLLDDIDLLD